MAWNEVNAHLWAGAPCSSFIWMSRGSTKRSRLVVKGCKRHRSVKQANKFVRRLCYLPLGTILWHIWRNIQTVNTFVHVYNPDCFHGSEAGNGPEAWSALDHRTTTIKSDAIIQTTRRHSASQLISRFMKKCFSI